MTLNNSGTQFGDISMRAKGTSQFFQPKNTTATIVGNTVFGTSIMDGSDNIISDMTDYLTANSANGGLGYTGYDSVKCERDTGIIIDGVGYDVATDSNYWSRLAGITYRSPISSKVVGDQLEATIGANVFLQSRINEIFANANNEIIPRVDTSFQEMYNVVKYGEENMNPIIWQDTTKPQVAARELLQDNRQFITDTLIDWIENNEEFYAYDSKACRRDVSDYILPAVKNDMLFDTNFNAVTAGEAYYMAAAKTVIENQNNETVAAYKRLKDQTNELLDGDSYEAAARTDAAFDEILEILENKNTAYTPTKATYDAATGKSVITLNTSKKFNVSNATYDPATGVFTATIGNHGMAVGDYIMLADNGITMSCDMGAGEVNHTSPQSHHPYWQTPCPITGVTDTTITMNVGDGGAGQYPHTFVSAVANAIVPAKGVGLSFTPTTATYNPETGMFSATIGKHGLHPGDYVKFLAGGVTFSCDTGSGPQNDAVPAPSHPFYNHPCSVESVTATTITMFVGYGGSNVHTFVSALDNSITHMVSIDDNASGFRSNEAIDKITSILQSSGKTYTTTNATYDPGTGLTVLTVGAHDLQIGDEINIAANSLTFTCDTDGNVTNYTYPTTTITNFTPTNASYDPATGVFTATIGAHKLKAGDEIEIAPESIVFTCAIDGNATIHPTPEAHHPFWKKKIKLTSVDSTTITANVGSVANGGGVHTFVSALPNAIQGERQHPAYKKPVVIASTTGTTLTVNVGTSSAYFLVLLSATILTFCTLNVIAFDKPPSKPERKAPRIICNTIKTRIINIIQNIQFSPIIIDNVSKYINDIDIHTYEYGQLQQNFIFEDSELYKHNPEFIFIIDRPEDIINNH